MMRPQNNLLDGQGQSDSGQQGGLLAKTNGKIAPALATDEGIFRIPIPMLTNETVLLGSVVGGCFHLSMQVCEAAVCSHWSLLTSPTAIPSCSA